MERIVQERIAGQPYPSDTKHHESLERLPPQTGIDDFCIRRRVLPTGGTHDEYTGKRGDGFLPELCEAWEQEARHCPPATRLVITRFGIVLSPDGGAMRQMLLPLKMKFAAVIAPGTQPFPWISIRDLCRAMAFIIANKPIEGAVNLVSPGRLTQHAFTRAVAKACHAWTSVTVPRFCFHVLYGEGATFLTTDKT